MKVGIPKKQKLVTGEQAAKVLNNTPVAVTQKPRQSKFKGLSKLIASLVVVVLVVAGGWLVFSRFSQKNKDKVGQLVDDRPDELPKELKDYNLIIKYYNEQKFSQVVQSAKDYKADSDTANYTKLSIYSMCLEGAVKIGDAESKEFCYKKAKEHLVFADNETKNQMAEMIEALYRGEQPTSQSVSSYE